MGDLRSIVQQHYKDLREQNWEHAKELFRDDVITEMPGAGTIRGVEPFIEYGKGFFRALPDAHIDVRAIIQQGNTVIAESSLVGTHNGPLATPDGNEIPPTGRKVELPVADVFEVEDGKVAKHRVYFDQMTLMTQLGLVPQGATA